MSTVSERWRKAPPLFRILVILLILLLLLLVCALLFLEFGLPLIRPTPTSVPTTPPPATTAAPTEPITGTETIEPTATNTPVLVETITPTEPATSTATLTGTVTTTGTPSTPGPGTGTVTPTETVTGEIEIRNVLRNGDFEKGFDATELGNYWNGFNNGNANFSYHIDDWDLVVVEGEYTQMMEIKEAAQTDRYLGIYQTADVISGEDYVFSMRGMVRTNAGDVQKTSYGYRLQVGFDLTGGDDWEAVEEWIELPWDEQLRVQDSFRVDAFSTRLTAESDQITVFIRAWKKWADAGEGDFDVDDIRLMGPALVTTPESPMPVTGAGDIWGNVRVWATVALLLLLVGGAIWRFGWKQT